MPKRIHEKKLLVEGDEDKRLIPQLVEANGIAWGEKEEDWIVHIDSYGGVENILKPGVIEVELKASGLRILGVLLDANESCAARWQSLRSHCLEAKNRGATYKESHIDKANIYTWLSWCDPPGRQLHDAVIQKIFNPTSPLADPFLTWFKSLYEL